MKLAVQSRILASSLLSFYSIEKLLLKINLVFPSVLLFTNASKSTCKSTHGTRLRISWSSHNYCYHLGHLWAAANQQTYISDHMTYGAVYI